MSAEQSEPLHGIQQSGEVEDSQDDEHRSSEIQMLLKFTSAVSAIPGAILSHAVNVSKSWDHYDKGKAEQQSEDEIASFAHTERELLASIMHSTRIAAKFIRTRGKSGLDPEDAIKELED